MGIILFLAAVCAMIGIIIASAYAIRIINQPTKIVYVRSFDDDPHHHITKGEEKEVDNSHDYHLFRTNISEF